MTSCDLFNLSRIFLIVLTPYHGLLISICQSNNDTFINVDKCFSRNYKLSGTIYFISSRILFRPSANIIFISVGDQPSLSFLHISYIPELIKFRGRIAQKYFPIMIISNNEILIKHLAYDFFRKYGVFIEALSIIGDHNVCTVHVASVHD